MEAKWSELKAEARVQVCVPAALVCTTGLGADVQFIRSAAYSELSNKEVKRPLIS